MSGAAFVIETLAGDHDRSAFACGSEPLDVYFRRQAAQDVKRRIASCLLMTEAATGAVAGFYTLSASSLLLTGLPEAQARRLPRHPLVPAALLGRLAVAQPFQRRHLGAALLADAAMRIGRAEIAAFAIVTDPKDEAAGRFYAKHGFIPLAGMEGRLFTPVESILKFMKNSP